MRKFPPIYCLTRQHSELQLISMLCLGVLWFQQLLRWPSQNTTEVCHMKFLFCFFFFFKKRALQIPGWPLALFRSSLWCIATAVLQAKEREIETWGGRSIGLGGWPPSSVSRALPQGKDVLNQAFVHRHNCSPARAQGRSVCWSINGASHSLCAPHQTSLGHTLQLTPPYVYIYLIYLQLTCAYRKQKFILLQLIICP